MTETFDDKVTCVLCPALCATLRANSPDRPLLEELGAAANRLQNHKIEFS